MHRMTTMFPHGGLLNRKASKGSRFQALASSTFGSPLLLRDRPGQPVPARNEAGLLERMA